MELNSKPTIQFSNVDDHETFTFPLIIVKGFIEQDNDRIDNDNNNSLVITYLDTDGNIREEFTTFIKNTKFLFTLSLSLGENTFLFKFKTNEIRKTFHHILSPSYYVVTPVYIICQGEQSHHVEHIKKKISIGCRLIQTLIAETLHQCGFGRKTFALEQEDSNGNGSSCLVFHSQLQITEAVNMTSKELWEYFGREIMTSEHGFQHRKFLSFLSYGKKKFSKHLAIGGGGLALCSSEFIHSWPSRVNDINNYFNSEISANSIHINNINSVYGNCFSASLGAVCHELCHTFDLGHTNEGIMGRDFDRVGILFSMNSWECPQKSKLENFNCVENKKDSLIICEGTFSRKLNISYSIHGITTNEFYDKNNRGRSRSLHKLNNNVFPSIAFWNSGCATLLAFHKWINQNQFMNINDIKQVENKNQKALQYDPIRNIINSEHGITVVQLRNLDGYVLKSWEFSSRRRKTLFLVPICESRKACSIVVQDIKGNLIKKDIEYSLYNL